MRAANSCRSLAERRNIVDIRIPVELRAKIPQLGEVSEQADPMVWVKLTCAEAGWTWYVIEVQELAANAIFYVYTVGWDEELHYLIRSPRSLRGGWTSVYSGDYPDGATADNLYAS